MDASQIAAIRGGPWHASWGYHSRASRAHRYVAMTMPKAACTTMKIALQTFEGTAPAPDDYWRVHDGDAGPTLLDYTDDEVVEMLQSPEYLRFCFVRNPYSRLVSAWKSKLATDDPQYERTRTTIRSACGDVGFRNAVEFMLANPSEFDDHWNRQVEVGLVDVIDYDIVGRFENFVDEFGAILRRLDAPAEVLALGAQKFNPTPSAPLAEFYDAPLAERVYEHYLIDFETFGYAKDSWRAI